MLGFKSVIKPQSYPVAMLKIYFAIFKFFSRPSVTFKSSFPFIDISSKGDQEFLASLKDRHKGERCFIIANGPSLRSIDLKKLKNEITIGCNGIYLDFEKWGFTTNYYVTADVNQAKIRSRELANLKGPLKLTSLHTAAVLPFRNGFRYFYKAKHHADQYAYRPPVYPDFSKDFASIVHHGYTISYTMLQLAFHLGFHEIYIVGLDHNYGELVERFPPGKLRITSENLALINECHFKEGYYKVGDEIGVPYAKLQTLAYECAAERFKSYGVRVFNVNLNSSLECFDRISFDSIKFGESDV